MSTHPHISEALRSEVGWDADAFEQHRREEETRYLDDLYLAGAAGNRLDAAWSYIEIAVGPRTIGAVRKRPTANIDPEDLWSEARSKLYEDDPRGNALEDGRQPAKIIRYRARIPLWSYAATIATRIAISKARRPVEHAYTDGTDLMDSQSSDMSHSERADLQSSFTKGVEQLTEDQRLTLSLVFGASMPQNRVAAMMGWSESKVSRQISAAVETIHSEIQPLLSTDVFTLANQILPEVWRRCWTAELANRSVK